MSKQQEAMRLALEALQGGADSWQLVGPAIDALKEALVEDAMQKFTDVNQELEAALAEPTTEHSSAVEPVAWRWGYRSVTTGEMDWRGYVEIAAHPNLRSPEIIMEPLYTAPPQRKPLTDEELDALAIDEDGLPNSHIEFARAIERAHNIT